MSTLQTHYHFQKVDHYSVGNGLIYGIKYRKDNQ